jgi:hypothetical protein
LTPRQARVSGQTRERRNSVQPTNPGADISTSLNFQD